MRLDDDLKYFESPEFKETLSQYEAMQSGGSSVYMDADDLTDVAEYYAMVEHDEERANEVIDYALRLHPDAVDPQIFRARQLMLDGEVEEARQRCDAIADQSHREVHFLRAELMVRDQKADEARDYLQAVADDVTEDLDFFLYDAAYIFIDYHDYANARLFAEKVEQMAPEWYKTFQLMADVLLGEEHYQQALTYIERMLDRDPFSTEAWNWSAEAHCGLSQYDEALESAEYALAVDTHNERAMQLKAWALLQKGNYEQAHVLYGQLQQAYPNCELHWLYDSYCLLDMDRTEEARAAIERAEELAEGMSQEQVTIYEQHAQILSELGDVEGALHYLDEADALPHESDMQVDYDLFRARVYAENNDPEKAMQFVLSCTQAAPAEHSVETCLRAAQLMFDYGHYSYALPMFQALLELAPNEEAAAELQAPIAACQHELGRHDEALETIRKATAHPAANLSNILGYLFPADVPPQDYYDYYYYQLHGAWPKE